MRSSRRVGHTVPGTGMKSMWLRSHTIHRLLAKAGTMQGGINPSARLVDFEGLPRRSG